MAAQDQDMHELVSLPRDGEGPVFNAPWEAQAFAMAVRLHEAGCFTWNEWAATLSSEISAAQARGDPDLGDTYYLHWLAALERILADKQVLETDERERRKDAWARAAAATPHGEPIVLPDDA